MNNNPNFEFDSRCPNSTYIPQIEAALESMDNSLLQQKDCTLAFLGDGHEGQEADRYLFWTSLDTKKVGPGEKIPVLIQTGDGNYYVSETTTGERTKKSEPHKGEKYIAVSEQITSRIEYKKFLKADAQYSSLTEAYDAYVKALAKDEYKGVREKCSCPTDSCAVSGITASTLASQSNQDIKALAHGSRCFYGIVRFPRRSTVHLPFPDFPCFYYIPYIDVRYKSFFVSREIFFKM